ncbi:Riboflavin kinase, partial [Zostera marina]
MGPAVLGVSVTQVSLIINTVFASFLATGSVSWLYYADRLMEFPTGLLGVALGTILLPSLSKAYASEDEKEYSELLDWGLRLTFMLAAPAAMALAVLATPLVTTLFHYGEFTANDVAMTHQALVAYSIGLLGLILVKILAPGFYARQNIKTPVKIAMFTLLITQVMNLIFIFGLHLGHAGLALAIGLGACMNALLLFYHLKKANIFQAQSGWWLFLFKLAIAIVVMYFVLQWAMGDASDCVVCVGYKTTSFYATSKALMQIFRHTPNARHADSAIAIGNFDGLHLGHQALLARLLATAKTKGLMPTVMTFEPHPREFFTPEKAPARLSSMREKLEYFKEAGIKEVYISRFNAQFAAMSAADFMQKILRDALNANTVLVGGDFCFGAKRQGNIQT